MDPLDDVDVLGDLYYGGSPDSRNIECYCVTHWSLQTKFGLKIIVELTYLPGKRCELYFWGNSQPEADTRVESGFRMREHRD